MLSMYVHDALIVTGGQQSAPCVVNPRLWAFDLFIMFPSPVMRQPLLQCVSAPKHPSCNS